MIAKRHHVRIESEGSGGRLFVDGQDISRNVASLDLHLESRTGAQMILDIAAFPLSSELTDVQIALRPEMHDFLIHLGWTPPEEGTSDVLD